MPGRRHANPWPYLVAVLAVAGIAAAVAILTARRDPPTRHAPQRLAQGLHRSTKPAVADERARTVRATVGSNAERPLPRSFLGLSFEYWDLPVFDSHPAALGRVFGLLRVPGDGPMPLRIGGDSADQSYWGKRPSTRLGPWSYKLTASWLNTLGAMVRADHLRVLLDLDLAQRAPRRAAAFALQAKRHLPRGSLMAFEIGNEPDVYHHWFDYRRSGRAGRHPAPQQWDRFSPARYARLFARYGRALAAVAPGIPLAGPDIAYPLRNLSWERQLLSADRSTVGVVTVHQYSLAGCGSGNTSTSATVARVLSPLISANLRGAVSPAVKLARGAGVPVRMTELGSITCQGQQGVSDSFASALWAPDELFTLWQAGLAGVNLHVRQGAANAAFSASSAGIEARPLLYGLTLFARAVGGRGELTRVRVGRPTRSVRLWAVRSGRRLNVLVLDKGPHPARLVLRVNSRRPALIERLSASSVQAASGVTLAGQTLSPDGRWVGPRVLERVAPSAGGRYRVGVPVYSGALISFVL